MSQFQKPALTDNDIVNIIGRLYRKTNDEIGGVINSAGKTIKDQKSRRLKGEFGEEAKNHPTKKEIIAGTTSLLGEEFLESRKNEDDFDPYEFMRVKEPGPTSSPV